VADVPLQIVDELTATTGKAVTFTVAVAVAVHPLVVPVTM
jgi:hypothetical protein